MLKLRALVLGMPSEVMDADRRRAAEAWWEHNPPPSQKRPFLGGQIGADPVAPWLSICLRKLSLEICLRKLYGRDKFSEEGTVCELATPECRPNFSTLIFKSMH